MRCTYETQVNLVSQPFSGPTDCHLRPRDSAAVRRSTSARPPPCPGLFVFFADLICSHGVEKNQKLVDQFIQSIFVEQPQIDSGKIAIAAALMQYLDDIRLQSLMMKHRSSPDIGRAEAKALHALSLAGRRAYTQGRIPPLEWPASKNWRNRYDK